MVTCNEILVGAENLKNKILPVVQYLKEIIPYIRTKTNPFRSGLRIQQLVLIVPIASAIRTYCKCNTYLLQVQYVPIASAIRTYMN